MFEWTITKTLKFVALLNRKGKKKNMQVYLDPDWSKAMAKIPASESSDPGCTGAWALWKLYPVLQSQKCKVPLSAPETKTPSELAAKQLTMALWPVRFYLHKLFNQNIFRTAILKYKQFTWINSPPGHFHCLMLSVKSNQK